MKSIPDYAQIEGLRICATCDYCMVDRYQPACLLWIRVLDNNFKRSAELYRNTDDLSGLDDIKGWAYEVVNLTGTCPEHSIKVGED